MDCYKKVTLLWIGLNKGSTNNYICIAADISIFHRSIFSVLVSTLVSCRYVTKYWYPMILDIGGTLVRIFLYTVMSFLFTYFLCTHSVLPL